VPATPILRERGVMRAMLTALSHVMLISSLSSCAGLEFAILSGLGLSTNVQRLSVTFMGCFGALSGMKAARAFAMECVTNRVLLVCTELCSIHMQLDDRVDNLVGSALFADGSGAMIVGCCPQPGERPLFEMHRNASLIIPETLDMMNCESKGQGETRERVEAG
jgi:predicted naringenin-chalcone synthase